MAIKQLSVLVENQKGALQKITQLLADNDVDLRSICIADTEEYGIMRLMANDNTKAAMVLSSAGYIAKVGDVVGIATPDKPGGLNDVLSILDQNNINLEYLYSMISGHSGNAYLVLRVDDNEKTEQVLAANGVKILTKEDF